MEQRRLLVTLILIPVSLVAGFWLAYIAVPEPPADLVYTPSRNNHQALLYISVLIPIVLCLLWRDRRDRKNRLWWLYGPLCGLWLMAANATDLLAARANVLDDKTGMQIAAPIRFVESRPIPHRSWGKRRSRSIGGLHIYSALDDPWRRNWPTSFYWNSVDLLSRISAASYRSNAVELANAHAPDWRGKCLFATVGQGTHDWHWISRERRIGACPPA